MECCICLSDITDKHISYTLSCNHKLHWNCYKDLIFKTTGNIFIKCPLCRVMNYSYKRPFNDPYKNIKILSSPSLKKQQCKHITKKGQRCKRSTSLLTYGYCSCHSTSTSIPKDKYELVCDYLYYILLTNNEWRTKINMIDMSKQMICKYPDKIKKLDDVHYYFNRFFQYMISKNNKNLYLNPNNLYKYYNLNPPPEEWVKECVENKTII